MIKQNLKVGSVGFILTAVYICTCAANTCGEQAQEITTSVDDYIENISAHYKNEIQIIEAELSKMELAFNKELLIVAYNQELAAKNARQLESRMRSTGTLNMKGKLCIQHFIGNVTLENVNLQTKLRACVDAARASSKSLADNAKNQIRNSRTQLQELMNTDLVLCRKNNANNVQKLTDCAREKLKVREVNVENMMKTTSKEIESCMCRSDIIARTAQECSFLVILDTHTLLSEIVSNINTCIGERLLEI